MAATAGLFAGTFAGAGVSVAADFLVAKLKKAVGCKKQCKKLQETIERIRPYLEEVEIQLFMKKNKSQQKDQIMVRWLADMKAQMEAANLEVHKCLSGHEVFSNFCVIENSKIGKRIEEVDNKINLLVGPLANIAQISHNLANAPQAANSPPVADTVQAQQNANALHHGYCSTPNIVQTANIQSQHALHYGHSLPAVRTSLYPPIAGQSMSQHSSPVSAHGTPTSWPWSNQTQAAASRTPPGTAHLHHSRSEPEVVRSTRFPDQWQPAASTHDHLRRRSIDHTGSSRGASSVHESLKQRNLESDRIKDAAEETRRDRRHSIANPPQHVLTSYQPSAPPLYLAPSAQARRDAPSASPLRSATLSDPYSLFYSQCLE